MGAHKQAHLQPFFQACDGAAYRGRCQARNAAAAANFPGLQTGKQIDAAGASHVQAVGALITPSKNEVN